LPVIRQYLVNHHNRWWLTEQPTLRQAKFVSNTN
jgi:hypothetical protein